MLLSMRGFTLIELLVAISIIAVIAVIGMSVYINVGKNTRDSRRKADLLVIRDAIEMYYNTHGRFPGWANCSNAGCAWWASSNCTGNDWEQAVDDIAYLLESNNFIQDLPRDPLNTGPKGCDTQAGIPKYSYGYEAWPDEPEATYYLCTTLETGSGSIQAGGYNYCLKGGCITCH